MSDEATARTKRVLEVLRASDKPIGPTEIARRIDKPWCVKVFGRGSSSSPQSNAINPLLATLVADGTVQRLPKGLYQIAVARPKSSATQASGAALSTNQPPPAPTRERGRR